MPAPVDPRTCARCQRPLSGSGGGRSDGLCAGCGAQHDPQQARPAPLARRRARADASTNTTARARWASVPFIAVIAGFAVPAVAAITIAVMAPRIGLGPWVVLASVLMPGWFLACVSVALLYSLRSKSGNAGQVYAYAARYTGPPVTEAHLAPRLATESLRGPGTNPPRWLTGMWHKIAAGLLVRENEVADWARSHRYPTPAASCPPESLPVRLSPLLDAGEWPLSQIRNHTPVPDTHPDGLYPVSVADINYLHQIETGGNADPDLYPSTAAFTWFPSEHTLVVVPAEAWDNGLWSPLGAEATTGEPAFDAAYRIVTDDPAWARLVLNPAVQSTLLTLAPVRLILDRGGLALRTLDGWAAPDRLDALAAASRAVARSARAAESPLGP